MNNTDKLYHKKFVNRFNNQLKQFHKTRTG